MLKKHKDKFKAGLLHSAEEYKKSVALLLDEFNNKGPFSSDKETSQVGFYSIFIADQAQGDLKIFTKFLIFYSRW